MNDKESSTEQNIVEEAVQFINDKYENSTLDTALEIGNHIFVNFFDSDTAAVASKDPKKKVSFNKLCDHPDLGLEKSQLSRMVNVAIQEAILKKDNVDCKALTYSHRVELLKIKDETAKLDMAKKCINVPLSIRALRDEMNKAKIVKDGDEVKALKITSQTMVRFEASEKSIDKIDELIADVDVKDLVTVTRNNLFKKATSLQSHMTETAANLAKLIEDIDTFDKEK